MDDSRTYHPEVDLRIKSKKARRLLVLLHEHDYRVKYSHIFEEQQK